MGFFLLGRSREGDDLRLVSEKLYSDRQAALDALSEMSAFTDFAHRDSGIFVVDLEKALPVLLVAPVEPEVAEVEELPEPEVAEEDVEPDVAADETAGVWETPSGELASGPDTDLATALKRATGNMESEGITAPESVKSRIPDAQVPVDLQPSEDVAVDQDIAADQDVIPDQKESADDAVAWPWDTESVTTSDVTDVPPSPEELVADVPPPPEEPVVDIPPPPVEPILDIPPPPENVSPPPAPPVEPVVITPPPPPPVVPVQEVAVEDDLSGILADLEPIEEPVAPAVNEPLGHDPAADAPVTSEPTVPEPAIDESVAAKVEPVSEKPEGYTTSTDTDVDTTNLTCDDCVYVNTCPHKDELQPASCGNFQWKSA